MKEEEPQHEHFMRAHKGSEDISELSDKLAPPEEIDSNVRRDSPSGEDDGPLVVDTGALKLPHGFVESEEEKRRVFGLEPEILVILTLLIVFIGLIAYLVYKMPAK